jgi:periplasmic copper chaperone A
MAVQSGLPQFPTPLNERDRFAAMLRVEHAAVKPVSARVPQLKPRAPALHGPTHSVRPNLKENTMKRTLFMLAALATLSAQAQTTVKDPWVRGTVAQQKSTGMFAQITSASGGKLVSGSSPVAGVVEIHEMAMDGNVMKMRAVPVLDLPAGKAVDLKPGGYHMMLMDLKRELKAGETVPVTLVIEDANKKRETVEVKATVRALASPDAHKP